MSSSPSRWQLDDLVVDADRGTVHRGEREVALPRLSFELLLALLRAAPGIATHAQLLDAVWPGVVVNEETLKQRVSLLRDALGDSSAAPRYVASVRGRGYRMAGEVHSLPASAMPPPAPLSDTASEHAGGWRRLLFLLPLALLIAIVLLWQWPKTPEPAATPRRLAVLPLDDFSAGEDFDWFAQGLHEEIIGRLATRRDLIVTSRTSVARYRKPDGGIAEIAAELGVDAILEGSVRREADRIRVTVQLIDAASDAHLWAESYDRDLGVAGILEIQRDLAGDVAGRLGASADQDGSFAVALPTRSLEAYDRQLLGRNTLWRVDEANLERARQLFTEALELDPRYVDAWEGLGWAWAFLGTDYGSHAPHDAFPQALEAARRALELDPRHYRARSLLLHIRHWYEWDRPGAEAGLRGLIAEQPTFIGAYLGLAYLLSGERRHAEALTLAQQAVALQPRDPWVLSNAGWRNIDAGDTARAAEFANASLALDPGNRDARGLLATVQLANGQFEDCAATRAGLGDAAGEAVCQALAGDAVAARTLAAAREQRYAESYANAYTIARLHAARGDANAAFAWLDRALADRNRSVLHIAVSAEFAALRRDPRFAALLQRSGQRALLTD